MPGVPLSQARRLDGLDPLLVLTHDLIGVATGIPRRLGKDDQTSSLPA